MKIAIIAGNPQQSLIESIVKAVEEKTGEKVEYVQVHEKDAEFLTQKVPVKPIILKPIEPYVEDPKKWKKKGHERPYKYHP